jgi:putative oxidoreductase
MGKVNRSDVGLLLLRIGLGSLFLFYGSQKMFGAFGGRGYTGQVDAFIGMGFPPLLAHLAILVEFLGGAAILIGFLTPFAGILLAIMMSVATYKSMGQPDAWSMLLTSGKGPDIARFFYTFILALAALSVGIMGAGRISMDAKLFRGKKS